MVAAVKWAIEKGLVVLPVFCAVLCVLQCFSSAFLGEDLVLLGLECWSFCAS